MARSKITAKYQVTIPRDVREKVSMKVGEIVSVEAVSEEEIHVKRFPTIADPLKVLIGHKPSAESVAISELEEKIES